MSALPIIRGGLQGLCPVTLSIHHDTFVQENADGSEQRWIRNYPMVKLDLMWGALARAEKETLKSDFSTSKGRFTANRSIAFNGVTYTNLACDSDVFEAVESETINYETKLTFSQVLSQSLSPGTAGQPFPTFRGAISQLPWTQRKRYFTTVSKLASGPQYMWAWFGSGLTNFPTDGLTGWQAGGPSLTDTELSDLTAHYVANWGRHYDFSYTDEDTTAYAKTHYAKDELVIVYQEPNRSSVSVGLEVTF